MKRINSNGKVVYTKTNKMLREEKAKQAKNNDDIISKNNSDSKSKILNEVDDLRDIMMYTVNKIGALIENFNEVIRLIGIINNRSLEINDYINEKLYQLSDHYNLNIGIIKEILRGQDLIYLDNNKIKLLEELFNYSNDVDISEAFDDSDDTDDNNTEPIDYDNLTEEQIMEAFAEDDDDDI